MPRRKHAPTPEQLEQADWSYDDEPAGWAPYKVLFALALVSYSVAIGGHGYYTFVDDYVAHPMLNVLCFAFSFLTAGALFIYAVRRDGFDAETRFLYIVFYFLAPVALGYLLFSGAGRLANVWLDFSSANTAKYTVVRKFEMSSRQYNQVKPPGRIQLRAEADARQIVVPVQRTEYEQALPGEAYLVTTRAGAFRRGWIARVEKAF
jgi:hypothetical protein